MVEGDWADRPIIVTGTWVGVLGWWDGTAWVAPSDFSEVDVAAGVTFQTVGLGSNSITTSTGTVETCEWSEAGDFLVEMADDDLMFSEILDESYDSVAISAPWPLSPNPVEILVDDGTHAVFAVAVLADLGVSEASPIIKQVVRVDLEGDGVDEKLVVAEDSTVEFDPTEGYSVVFMRRLVDGEVRTSVLASEIDVGAHMGISGIADLNGDGVMEVVLAAHGWEWSTVSIHELSEDELEPVLHSGCGV